MTAHRQVPDPVYVQGIPIFLTVQAVLVTDKSCSWEMTPQDSSFSRHGHMWRTRIQIAREIGFIVDCRGGEIPLDFVGFEKLRGDPSGPGSAPHMCPCPAQLNTYESCHHSVDD